MTKLVNLVLFAFVMALTVAATATGGAEWVGGTRGEARGASGELGLKYQPLPQLIPRTIQHLTKELYDSLLTHDVVTTLDMFTDRSCIVYHSLMPASGVFRGSRGMLEYLDYWTRTVHLTNFSYRILFVDEAREESVVEAHFSGSFLRNKVKFTDLITTDVIRWSLGKVQTFNIIDQNPQKLYSLFATKAETSRCKLVESIFKCGACEDTMSLISDDVVIQFPGFYPTSLLTDVGLQQELPKGDGRMSAGHEDTVVALKGKQGFANFVHLYQKLLFDRIVSSKVLFGNESTVVAMYVLKPEPKQEFIQSDAYLKLKMSAVLFTISRFNEKGQVVDVEFLLNRPVMPWDLNRIRGELGAISRAGSLKGNQTTV